jgi:L-ascorbate metabolism protein UlaG (beta-lactamase superfamily)
MPGTGVEPASLLFIGNATVLIRYAGFTVLTDPNFLHQGQRAHLGWGLSSRRRTDPALDVAELPPLDAVVLSHLHGDHFDRVARRGLDRDVPIVSTRHAAGWLRRWGFREARGLHTWQVWQHRKEDGATLTVTSVPARHAPGPLHALIPPAMGSVMEFSVPGERPYRIYQTGDTLLTPELAEITRRCPDLDLALLHLGGTKVFGVLLTMDGEQGAGLLELIPVPEAVPIHYDDYTVFTSPLADFRRAVSGRGLRTRVHYLERGQSLSLAGSDRR